MLWCRTQTSARTCSSPRDTALAVDEFERFRPLTEPLRPPGPLVSVRTNRTVYVDATAEALRAAISDLAAT